MAADEDQNFSFPATFTDSPPCFIESPPLWNSNTKTNKSEKLKGKQVAGAGVKLKLSSHQEFEGRFVKNPKSRYSLYDKEEKMDMMWENLNDENQTSSGKRPTVRYCDNASSSPGNELVQVRSSVKTLNLSKANDHMFSGKKSSILVLAKAFKKVFIMHNPRHSIKKHS